MSESLSTVLTAMEPTLLTTGWGRTEGPLWHAGGSVTFVDLAGSRLLRWDPADRAVTVVREQAGEGNGCPDGIHYDVKGNLWAAIARLGGIIQIDPRGLILGFVPVPNGDLVTTNFAFGGPDNQYIYLEGAISGTFWRFKAPYPGLIGPGGARLPAQP